MPVIRQNIQPPSLPLRRVDGHILYSHIVSVAKGRLIFISGQLARDASGAVVGVGDMAAQIEQVGRNIEACLAAAGASLSDLVRTTTYTTDIEEYFKHVEVRMRYFGAGMPTSTTVEVRRLSHPDFMVEVETLAVVE
jgi:enamine deaminase RidA (YjgF/YER057c/UK114 family)